MLKITPIQWHDQAGLQILKTYGKVAWLDWLRKKAELGWGYGVQDIDLSKVPKDLIPSDWRINGREI